MPSYQPKMPTRYVQYPCRICGDIKKDCDMFITGIDESNASITKNACKNPICRWCFCETDPLHRVCKLI